MFYFNTLNLKQLSGGNQVKQGDFGSTFTYELADEKGRELNIFDQKTAYVNLVLNNNIVFTTTVIVDGSTVTFNIDKAIPTGLYFLEIKIDSYILPSDRQTIILVTAGAVAYDLKDLVPNYDTNMTITGILSDLSQKGIDINDLKTKMSAIYNNALADHAEIIQARGGQSSLDARLDGLDARDTDLQNQINTNKTSITTAGSRIDNLIANAGNGTVPSELTDMRVGIDASYPTAGASVRGQITNLTNYVEQRCAKVDIVNLLDASKITSGKYVESTNGNIVTVEGFAVSNDIIVEQNTTYYIYNYKKASAQQGAWYDASGKYISGFTSTAESKRAVTSPEKAKYLKLTIPIDSIQKYVFTTVPDLAGYIPRQPKLDIAVLDKDELVNKVRDKFAEIESINLLDSSKFETGFYIDYTSGTKIANTSSTASGMIEVTAGLAYYVYNFGRSYIQQGAWYDASGKYISGFISGKFTKLEIVAPANAKYINLTIENIDTSVYVLSKYNNLTKYVPYKMMVKQEYLPTTVQSVNVGPNEQYTTILEALKATDNTVEVYVKRGTYDLFAEYTKVYGSDFWTNYTGYAGKTDVFMRGLWVNGGRKIIFEPGAVVTAIYDGTNDGILHQFAPFAAGGNGALINLHLKYKNTHYAVHDDFATGSGTMLYQNCIFEGVAKDRDVIGAGVGLNNTYIFDSCVFLGNNYRDITYHGNAGGPAKNLIVVKNCFGSNRCQFNWYGTSDEVTTCIVHGSSFGKIVCQAHGRTPNDKVNMRLVGWNNTETNPNA